MSSAARRVLSRRSRLVGAAAQRAVGALERRLLRRSHGVVVISEDFLPLLRRWAIDASRVAVIENWAPLPELPVLPSDNAWSREHGYVGRTVFLYSGTLGFKHDPSLLLELARWARTRDALVVVVSEGPGAAWLAEHGSDEGALRLLPYQPHDRLPEVLASAAVLVALLEPEAGVFSVPSKILTYLCAAKPLLGDTAELLAAAGSLLEDAELRAVLSKRGRAYAETAFDVDSVADRFEEVLEQARSVRR
jgi:colanic acid biosynthesis glycosyl transferase WcaI